MSGKNKQKEELASMKSGRTEFVIREIKDGEAEKGAELIARLKRLNGEFDPLLKTSGSVDTDSLRSLKDAVSDKNAIVLVALDGARLVGVVKAILRDRIYYEPRKEGAIVEFYILPEFRRGSLGRELFDSAVSRLEKRGAVLITAEFPSQNEIAKKFYTKLGFRSLTNVYARSY